MIFFVLFCVNPFGVFVFCIFRTNIVVPLVVPAARPSPPPPSVEASTFTFAPHHVSPVSPELDSENLMKLDLLQLAGQFFHSRGFGLYTEHIYSDIADKV